MSGPETASTSADPIPADTPAAPEGAPALRPRPAPAVPVTQDVLTLPRKLPEGGPINLVGLTRAQLHDALIAAGTPEKQAKMRTR